MKGFISDAAKDVWDIFEKTGSVSAYLLYSAIQNSSEKELIAAENSYENKYNQDSGMEL